MLRIAAHDIDRLGIPFDDLAFLQQVRGMIRGAEPRLSVKSGGVGKRHEGRGVQPIFQRKSLGLAQRLTGDHGDLDHGAIPGPVEHQIVDVIGGPAFQRRADLHIAMAVGRAGCAELKIEDLILGYDQLCRHPMRRQTKRRTAQIAKGVRQIGRVNRG